MDPQTQSIVREQVLGRLSSLIASVHVESPRNLIGSCLEDLRQFLGGAPKGDDLTILAIRRRGKSAG